MKITIIIFSIIFSTSLSIRSENKESIPFFSNIHKKIPKMTIVLPGNSKNVYTTKSLILVNHSLLGIRVKPSTVPLPKPFNTYFVQDATDKKEQTYTLPFKYIRHILPLVDQGILYNDYATMLVSKTESGVRASLRFYFPWIDSKSYRNDFVKSVISGMNQNDVVVTGVKQEINQIINQYDKTFNLKSASPDRVMLLKKSTTELEKEVGNRENALKAKQDEIQKINIALGKLESESAKLARALKVQKEVLEKKKKQSAFSLAKLIGAKVIDIQTKKMMKEKLESFALKFKNISLVPHLIKSLKL